MINVAGNGMLTNDPGEAQFWFPLRFCWHMALKIPCEMYLIDQISRMSQRTGACED